MSMNHSFVLGFHCFSLQFIIDAVESFNLFICLQFVIEFAWDYGFQQIPPIIKHKREKNKSEIFSPQYWLFSEDLKLMNCAVSSRSMINTWKKCVFVFIEKKYRPKHVDLQWKILMHIPLLEARFGDWRFFFILLYLVLFYFLLTMFIYF